MRIRRVAFEGTSMHETGLTVDILGGRERGRFPSTELMCPIAANSQIVCVLLPVSYLAEV